MTAGSLPERRERIVDAAVERYVPPLAALDTPAEGDEVAREVDLLPRQPEQLALAEPGVQIDRHHGQQQLVS